MSSDRPRGYEIPNPIDPGSLQCIRVYVPDDQKYLDQFWQAYEWFTYWLAWIRDPLKKGKQAANVWRLAYEKARSEYALTGGCGMAITDIRIDPLNPCGIQVQIDGGPAWVDKLDVSCCGGGGGGSCPVLRVSGGQVQSYNHLTARWSPTGPVIVPNTDGIIDHPLTGVSNGACVAARNAALYLEARKNYVVALMATLDEIITAFTETMANLSQVVAGETILPYVFQLLTAMGVYLVANREDIVSEDITDDLTCILVNYYEADGSMTQANHDLLMVNLEGESSDLLPGTVRQGAFSYVGLLVRIYGIVGMSKIAGMGMVDTYDCSSCGWEYTFDFLTSKQGWAANYEDLLVGTWEHLVGWRESFRVDTGAGTDQLVIGLHFIPTAISYVSVSYDLIIAAAADPGVSPIMAIRESFPDTGGTSHVWTPVTGENQSHAEVITGTISGLLLYLISDHTPGVATDPGGTAKVKSITVRGTGVNPFA